MYNVFTYDKQMSQTQRYELAKEKFIKNELKRRSISFTFPPCLIRIETQEKMSANYRKRVENFVLHVSLSLVLL